MSEEQSIEDASREESVSSDLRISGENWVIFTVSGEAFNPELISVELNLEPDRVFRPDAHNPMAMWQINSRLSGSESLEAHFWDIMNRLLPSRKNLMKIARDAELHFYCNVKKQKVNRQYIHLSPRLLILVGYIGAGIDIEFFED